MLTDKEREELREKVRRELAEKERRRIKSHDETVDHPEEKEPRDQRTHGRLNKYEQAVHRITLQEPNRNIDTIVKTGWRLRA